jgi:hypothetical protein
MDGFGCVNRRQPVTVFGDSSGHYVEEQVAQFACDRAYRASSQWPVLDLRNGRDLYARAAQERFFGQIDFRAVDFPLDHIHVQFLGQQFNERLADDALKDVGV